MEEPCYTIQFGSCNAFSKGGEPVIAAALIVHFGIWALVGILRSGALPACA